ncbi:ribonuclease H-like domain-containing protein [Tanacetum coccineum]
MPIKRLYTNAVGGVEAGPIAHADPTNYTGPTDWLSGYGPSPIGSVRLTGSTVTSGQATFLPHAFIVRTLHDPASDAWNMDTCASSHLNNLVNSLSENFNTCMYPSISVGDGYSIRVTNTGYSILPPPLKSLHLNNVLITPHIVKNLISIRQFVRDNNCTVEFDALGFFVKDFMTRRVLLRCNSMGDLYPVTQPSPIPHAFLTNQHMWHQRLGHPGSEVLRHLVSRNLISCNKEKPPVLCHACQLGKHVRLPFVSSNTLVTSCFDIVHSYLADGTLSFYKARLVANGSTQLEGVDVNETFSPVVKPGTIQTVFSLAASRHWPIHQLDVKNAFLHAVSLWAKTAPRAWFQWFASYITRVGFSYSRCDSSLFIYRHGTDTAYLLLYYDDNVLYSTSPVLDHISLMQFSSAEAECHGVANAIAETYWLRNLLRELHSPLSSATLVYCDNARVLHVPSRYQFADIFTKGLPSALFEEFRTSLRVRCPPAPTAGECYPVLLLLYVQWAQSQV